MIRFSVPGARVHILLEDQAVFLGVIAADQPFEPVVLVRSQADFLGELLVIGVLVQDQLVRSRREIRLDQPAEIEGEVLAAGLVLLAEAG